jgi:hypothetical protein
MTFAFDLRSIARALGGDVVGGEVLAPGRGHARKDRSLSIKLSASSPDGFIVHSFAGENWRDCRDYLQRGRQHEGPPEDALKLHLIGAFRAWAANPRGRTETTAANDLTYEFDIRGIEFPWAEVASDFEVIRRTAKAVFAARDDEEKRKLGEVIMDCRVGARSRQQ